MHYFSRYRWYRLTLLLLVVIIYSNTFLGTFHFDDVSSIVKNPAIKNIYNLGNIWDFWPTRFITYLSIAINYGFGKLNVFGYHFVNLIIHLICAILVCWLVRLTFSTPAMEQEKIAQYADLFAFFAGLIFLTHPIQTQAVTYIIQRSTSLAALCYLASLCLYARSRLQEVKGSFFGKQNVYYWGALVAAVAAMFTKEMTITLPLAILLYEICFFKTEGKINYRYLVPFFIILAIIPLTLFLTKTVNFSEMHLVSEPASSISPIHYFFTQLRAMVTYLRLLFLPLKQNLDYDYPIYKSLLGVPVLVSFIFLGTIIFVAVKILPKYRLISFCIFWFFLTLLPESSIIPIRDVIFEHRLYLPMAGFSIFLVTILYYLIGRKKLKPLVLTLLLIVTCYSIFTYHRNYIWKDEFTLWKDVIRKSPHKARPYHILADAYQAKGDLKEAISLYNKAIQLEPQYYKAYNNRGNIYAALGNYALAIADYARTIQLYPKFAEAYNNLGNMNLIGGDFEQALKYFSKAIEIMPRYAEAYSNRGIAYQSQGKFDWAIVDYNKAIQLDPGLSCVYGNRAVAYFFMQKFDKSWEDVHKAEAFGYTVNPDFLSELKKTSPPKTIR